MAMTVSANGSAAVSVRVYDGMSVSAAVSMRANVGVIVEFRSFD